MINDGYPVNGEAHRNNTLMILLPNGHLEKPDVWSPTGLPWGISNYDSSKHPGRVENCNLFRVAYPDMVDLGYPPVDNLEDVSIAMHRPHDIPLALLETGYGISGRDLVTDRLRLNALNGNQGLFEEELLTRGVISMGDLEYRRSHIALLVRCDAPHVGGTGRPEDFKKFVKLINDKGEYFRVATEYPWIASHALENILKPQGTVAESVYRENDTKSGRSRLAEKISSHDGTFDYDVIVVPDQQAQSTDLTATVKSPDGGSYDYSFTIKWSTGQTEAFLGRKGVGAIVETLETGRSALDAEFIAVGGLVLQGSTPYALVNRATYEKFGPAIDYLQERVNEGVGKLETCPDKLDRGIFFPLRERMRGTEKGIPVGQHHDYAPLIPAEDVPVVYEPPRRTRRQVSGRVPDSQRRVAAVGK